MKMKINDLFFGCLGNGIIVANRAVIENGDYKNIAHIADYGKITWYVSKSRIPSECAEKIVKMAEAQKEKFLTWWNSLPVMTRYEKLLDAAPLKILVEAVNMKGYSIEEKVNYLETQIKEYIHKEN